MLSSRPHKATLLAINTPRISQLVLQSRRPPHHHTFRFRALSPPVTISPSHLLSTHNLTLTPINHKTHPSQLQAHHHSTTSPPTSTPNTMASPNTSPQPPSYDHALRRLSQLQSNKTITNLFSTTDPNNPPPTGDLNALAMPEMLAWLSRTGYTPSSLASSGLRCVHVAGTKGKGSVSTLIASILTQYVSPENPNTLGDKIGLYTSPHVLSVRERIQINGEPISQEKFALYFFQVWDRLSQAARENGDLLPSTGSIQTKTTSQGNPTQDTVEKEEEDPYDGPSTKPFYFRFLTLLAFHIFIKEGVKSAVIECGIGGEYDPTNILIPEMVTACVITQLGIDHVSMLGDTVPKIAWHKAGILKKGVRGFTRLIKEYEEVMGVLRARAEERGAVLEEVDDEEVERWWDGEGERGIKDGEAKLQGPFQKYNMAVAVKAAREHLVKMGVEIGDGDGGFVRDGKLRDLPGRFVTGLKSASLRGRCEVFVDRDGAGVETEWFIDGAHTEDSLRGVGQWFGGLVGKGGDDVRILLFNQQDRDPAVLLKALLSGAQEGYGGDDRPVFTHAIFTRNEENPPTEGEEVRDLEVQEKAQDVFREFVGSAGKTETWTQNAVIPAIGTIRDLARKAKEDGKSCKVLATGSFHLVGAVLKTIDHVEY